MSAYKKLETIFTKHSHLQHLDNIMHWDEAVMMPSGGGASRADSLATLKGIMHEIISDPKLGELINSAKEEDLENSWECANLAWMEKAHRDAVILPDDLVKATTKAALTCEQAWRQLRAENNWKAFAPLLKNNLALVKESAFIRAEARHMSAYDVLIDDYSPGMNQSFIDPIFAKLKETLPDLVRTVIEKQKQNPAIIPEGRFPIEKQKQLGLQLMGALGFDFNHGRLDVSHHPFCGGVADDVRVTTRYSESEFISAAMATCHETGHARYEQNLPKKWANQPVGMALGMSIHESQSLLVEMQACRSHEFMQFLSPLTKNQFGDESAFNPENLHRLYTGVKRSYIRVEADEVTYPLHVILRYELEKALIEGNLNVDDLPAAWNDKMEKYLGLSTLGNDRDGAMQDVHWPSGAFGYFPAYTLGSLIAAQLFAAAKRAHPNLLNEFSHGNFSDLFNWLTKHVHSRASSVSSSQLIRDASGEDLSANYFIDHIKARYL